jgi:excisionase family DNA binding protein
MKPLLLSIDEAANLLSIGKTKLYAELAAGRLQAVKLGKRRGGPRNSDSMLSYFL